MANKKSELDQVEIPALKKEEKERKGGAPPILAGGGVSAVSSTLGTGTGAAGVGSAFLQQLIPFLTGNIGLTLVTGAAVGAIVYGVYSVNMAQLSEPEDPVKQTVFAKKGGAAAALAGTNSSAPSSTRVSSIGFFNKANRGALDHNSLEGEVQAAAHAATDASAGSAAVTNDAAMASGPIGPGLSPSQATSKANLPNRSIGKLSTHVGGGNSLAGGGGMSSGVAKQFANAMDGKSTTQQISVMPGQNKASVNKVHGTPVLSGRKGAMAQLRKSSGESIKARGSTSSEAAAYHAAQGFTAAPSEQGGSTVQQRTTGSGGVATIGGAATEGPINSSTDQHIVDNQTTPSTGASKNVTPWQSQLVMAQTLLLVAAGIITIMGIVGKIPILGPIINKILYGIAAGLAASATTMGVMIMNKHGQQQQGMIITTGGAITTAAAAAAMFGAQLQSWMMVLAGVAGISAAIGSMLIKNKVH
ncbi:MAG: hypothetical protein HY059_09925 [Proteobacteria bacterium]|nr:hypothetical protein [Pseudomonadota bacterium]